MPRLKNFKYKQDGFTLIELSFVILASVFIGLIAIKQYRSYIAEANTNETVEHFKILYKAAADWRASRNSYSNISCARISDYLVNAPITCTNSSPYSTSYYMWHWGGDLWIEVSGFPSDICKIAADKLRPSSVSSSCRQDNKVRARFK